MRRFSVAMAALVCSAAAAMPMSAGADSNSHPVFTSSGTVVFDFVPLGSASTKSVTISNTGDAPLVLSRVEMTGPNAKDFAVTADGCTGKSLGARATCDIGVRFTPGAAGTRVGSLKFTDNTPCHNWISLAGSGSTPAPRAMAATCETSVRDALDSSGATTPTAPTAPTAPAAPTTTQVGGQSAISLPKSCVSRRKIRIHLAAPARSMFKRVTIKRGNKTIKKLAGKSIKSTIALSGLPRGRFTITVTGVLTNGKTVKQSRHYVTCVSSKS